MLAVIRSIWPVETLVPARMGFRRDSRRERGGVCGEEGVGSLTATVAGRRKEGPTQKRHNS